MKNGIKKEKRIEVFSFRKSFSRLSMFDGIYLRYIQFRTLHRRFYTDNLLYKMGLKDSPLCDFCHSFEDSNNILDIYMHSVTKSPVIW